MKNRFGVAVRSVDVAAPFEFFAEVCVVVDFAVVGYAQPPVFVRHRLMACGHINDAQAPVAESDLAVNVSSGVVRPAVRNHVPHAFERAHVQLAARTTRQGYSVNSAHTTVGEQSGPTPDRFLSSRHLSIKLKPLAAHCGPPVLVALGACAARKTRG